MEYRGVTSTSSHHGSSRVPVERLHADTSDLGDKTIPLVGIPETLLIVLLRFVSPRT